MNAITNNNANIYLILFILGIFAYLVVMCIFAISAFEMRKKIKKSLKDNTSSGKLHLDEMRNLKKEIDEVHNLILINKVDKLEIVNNEDSEKGTSCKTGIHIYSSSNNPSKEDITKTKKS